MFRVCTPVRVAIRHPTIVKNFRKNFADLKTAQEIERRKLLLEIYKPFRQLKPGSEEYKKLGRSGRVWEDYFKPSDMQLYQNAQEELEDLLRSIDMHRGAVFEKVDIDRVSETLIGEYAHQSVAIEGNRLMVGDSVAIYDKLSEDILGMLKGMEIQDVTAMDLPAADVLLPDRDCEQVTELRNHVLVSRYIADTALAKRGTPGLSLAEICEVQKALLRDTSSEEAHQMSWGKRTSLGEYRQVPIQVRSNPLAIFPYQYEVPACMERFVQWRDRVHETGTVHPLIMATHLYVYFVRIHPFLDGNGRVGRCLMADYLLRQGYLPVVFRFLDRESHIRLVAAAANNFPSPLCRAVVDTQFEMFMAFLFREE